GIQAMWSVCRLFARTKANPDRIQHVFVLMLENRSFDHLLGFSNLQGIDAVTGQSTTIEGLDTARDWNLDPHGKKVTVSSPDDWFSSMPGPTWPNRFFIHAASSAGLDHSPSTQTIASSILLNGYTFDNGTIYDRLDDEGISWTIYKGDPFPQALVISGMTVRLAEGRFRDFEDFAKHVRNPNYSTSYAFLEPDYHSMADFVCGNSQHPKDDVTRGEALIKNVYEAIRNSPHWESSVLIITYDEHGGFYDHVPPPRTVAPGDKPTDPENSRFSFD